MSHQSFFTLLCGSLLTLSLTVPLIAQSDSNPVDNLPPAPQDAAALAISPTSTPDATPAPSVTATPTATAATATPTATPLPKPAPEKAQSLRSIVHRMKLKLPLPQARIVVDKSERRLSLFNGNTLIKSYRVALGTNPQGHKQRQGDGRTPEGQFYICTRNATTSAFHIFLGLSYPALPDATRGVRKKIITAREYQLIRQRLASRGRPLWETNLGGWVGIHGGTNGAFAKRKAHERGRPDWTAGCIALTNAEIDEIYAATRLGTPVLVQP